MMQKNLCSLVLVLSVFSLLSYSQTIDSTRSVSHFSGSLSVTNNGISLIPTFSLGKPAAIVNLSMGKGKLSFEPELRFSLEGKPWSFLFWWRYRLKAEKFSMNIGAHPALNFKTESVSINGDTAKHVVTRRYLAGELAPNYLIAKNVSIGMYYLYSRGIDKGTTRITHFLTLNSNFSNIKLTKQFFIRFIPQFYYLKLDDQDGFYVTAAMTLAKRNFPFSLSAIVNKTIETDITASKSFVWNASLVYSFNKNYVKK